MEKVRYMISDAATMAGVESHVLRYWEEELDLTIPRNEMGHRYYTRENIQEFQKIKELKEQGYQLKAIRMILHPSEAGTADSSVPAAPAPSSASSLSPEDRMSQFREIMSDIVGHAIAQNNEELSMNIGQEVKESVLKEMNYLFREQEEAQEERYKKLDSAIRGHVRKKRSLFSAKQPTPEESTS